MTLDETIKNLEDGLKHLNAILISEETWNDSLQYLKEYREKHDDILRMEEALGYCEISDNPPLTWDELTDLVGKPVWVEYTYQGEWRPDKGEWIIINLMGDDDLIDQTGEGVYPKSVYGKTWQAYRKERK